MIALTPRLAADPDGILVLIIAIVASLLLVALLSPKRGRR